MSAIKYRVSVIILAYNEEATLGACLESIMQQTIPADEVIVVNNNSVDRTAEIANSYPNVTVIDEPKQGFIPARHRGFESAKHEIMIRCDADTVLPPDRIAVVKEIFANDRDAVAASGPVHYYDAPVFKRLLFPFPGNHLYMKLVGCWPTLVGPNMIITKQVWEQVKGKIHLNDAVVHEDMDLSIHVRQFGLIRYDKRLGMTTSARRLRDRPQSLLLAYSWRNLQTLFVHGWPFGYGMYRRARRRK